MNIKTMNKSSRLYMLGLSLIAVGIIIVTIVLSLTGGKAVNLRYTEVTYTATGAPSTVTLDIKAGSARTEFYDGDKIQIAYGTNKLYAIRIDETSTELKLKSDIHFVSFLSSAHLPETIIRLPKSLKPDMNIKIGAGKFALADGNYGKLDISVSAGEINVGAVKCSALDCDIGAGSLDAESVVCQTFDCDIDTGEMSVTSLSCTKADASVGAGKISLTLAGKKSEYTISAHTSVGSCNVSDQRGSTDKRLELECSTGDIKIHFDEK